MVPTARILDAAVEQRADIVGLSGLITPVARRDGRRRRRDGAPALHRPAAHRRRDHQPPAHRRQDRARVRRADRLRARRLARGRRRQPAAESRAPGPSSSAANRAEQDALREKYGRPRHAHAPAAAGGPRERGRAWTGREPRRRCRRSSAAASSTTSRSTPAPVHRLDVLLRRLAGEGPLPGGPRPPGARHGGARALRRRPADAAGDRGRPPADGAGVYGFWPAASRRRRHRPVSTTRLARDELARFPMLRQQEEQPDRGREPQPRRLRRAVGRGGARLRRRVRRDGGHRRGRTGRALPGRAGRLPRHHGEGPGRPPGRGVRGVPPRARRGASGATGATSASTPSDLRAEKYRGIRPAFGYPACPDHREKRRLFALLDAVPARASRSPKRARCRRPRASAACTSATRSRSTSRSAESAATRSKTTPAARA